MTPPDRAVDQADDRTADPAVDLAADPAVDRAVDPPGDRAVNRAVDPGRQLSLFGAEAAEPSVSDLAGLLAGSGEVVRMGGTARLSVVLDAAWRVHVLVAEFARRGIAATWEPTADGRYLVRTSYASTLAPLATAWLRAGVQRPPAGFHLDGRRLRLWSAASGSAEPAGFLLGLSPDESTWEPIGAALAALGLPAVLLDGAAGGPAYRIVGRRRLARLVELVGDPPSTTPPTHWPAPPARRPA
ncbi:hypothetical protein [Micromonospora sp. SH-82]|uniref:hypothetical protein n=1 Tax=Micromonospora sp. SH-82 TaxID=3132938 RepID=UPI003EB75A93